MEDIMKPQKQVYTPEERAEMFMPSSKGKIGNYIQNGVPTTDNPVPIECEIISSGYVQSNIPEYELTCVCTGCVEKQQKLDDIREYCEDGICDTLKDIACKDILKIIDKE